MTRQAGVSAAPKEAGGRLLSLPGLLSLAVFLLLSLQATPAAAEAAEEGHHHEEEPTHRETNSTDSYFGEEPEEGEATHGALFPWFVQALGVVVFYIMSRYIHALPYTAIMFILGTLMGIGSKLSGNISQLTESITMWTKINGELILLVFLPGLLFWDALNVNWFLFTVSINQLLIMAFPMVLAGAVLTACVGFFIFPYGWSFILAMTFGSILAATDPVAVAALLNEVGAPPRLKMHISGESMLNDGSAVVFFNVFSKQFLAEVGMGHGHEHVHGHVFTVAEGFALFFRMSLGGTAIGLAFGVALILIWYKLRNHLNHEENIIQVIASITIAYLSYYTSEMVCHMSGIVAVIMCGITARAFGGGMINKPRMMENFWHLVEHLLNTLLFALGGLEWGHIIATGTTGRDWGYLFILYVLLHVIRFFLFFSHYPIISRIGLKTNWQETFFTSFGGLRGAVGIALALALNNEVHEATEHNLDANGQQARLYTTKLLTMVGGIAFLTLVINGTTAGYVLNKLGLAKMTDTRVEILDRFKSLIKMQAAQFMVELLTEARFSMVDFAVIRHHVPYLKDLTAIELKEAVHKHKESVPRAQYKAPNLTHILPYLEDGDALKLTREEDPSFDMPLPEQFSSIPVGKFSDEDTEMAEGQGHIAALVKELRYAFLDLLMASYMKQIEEGELNPRENGGFLVHVLEQSIDFASDAVSKGRPLQDWAAAHIDSDAFTDRTMVRTRVYLSRFSKKMRGLFAKCTGAGSSESPESDSASFVGFDHRTVKEDYRELRTEVYKALAFIHAHRMAQEHLEADFADEAKFRAPMEIVLCESEAQVKLAEELLTSKKEDDVKMFLSHLFCKILLQQITSHVEHLTAAGRLKEKEARVYEEDIEKAHKTIEFCAESKHPGELTTQQLKDSAVNNISSHLKKMKQESSSRRLATRRSTLIAKGDFMKSMLEIRESDGGLEQTHIEVCPV